MPSYLSPGVYMEEIDKGSKPIEAVGTAVAAFIGYTDRAVDERNGTSKSLIGKPTLVTNWSQYVQKFGGFIDGAFTPDSVYGYFANGGGNCYIVSIKTLGQAADPSMMTNSLVTVQTEGDKPTDAIKFIAREGGPSGNNISVDVSADPAPDDKKGSAPSTFTVSIKVNGSVAERFDGLSTAKGDNNVQTVLETQSKLVTAEVVAKSAVVPASGEFDLAGGEVKTKAITLADYQGSVTERVGLGGLEPIDDVTMIIMPDLMTAYQNGELDMKGVQSVQQTVIDYCELVRYCFAILDCPPGMMPQEMKEWRMQVNYDSSRAALYYPWIEGPNMTGSGGSTRMMPPSGHVAGVYARTDGTRGVHKAPANELVRGIVGLEVNVTKGEHDLLNPASVNVIRSFPGRGIRIWGARTLSSDPSWRYINVRRLFSMIEESIENGTQWVVFEPNDASLWARVTRDVTSFLKTVWATGALFGATPGQAFYVKCDAETNPPETRDLGQLITEIGIAPVKPAEFVIFRVSQWNGDS